MSVLYIYIYLIVYKKHINLCVYIYIYVFLTFHHDCVLRITLSSPSTFGSPRPSHGGHCRIRLGWAEANKLDTNSPWVKGQSLETSSTNLKFNSESPWKVTGPQKERIVFQPSFFRGYVKLRGCNASRFAGFMGSSHSATQHRMVWINGRRFYDLWENVWMHTDPFIRVAKHGKNRISMKTWVVL